LPEMEPVLQKLPLGFGRRRKTSTDQWLRVGWSARRRASTSFPGHSDQGVAGEPAHLPKRTHFAGQGGPKRLPFVPFPAIQ
jgi:hypothetical protein